MPRIIISVLLLLTVLSSQAQYRDDFLGTKNKKAKELFDKGSQEAMSGNLDKAMDNFLKAAEKDPTYVDAYLMVARLWEEKKDETVENKLKQAEKYYSKALEVNPSYTKAHYFMGSMYFRAGKYVEAESQYRQYLAGDTTGHRQAYLRTAVHNLKICEIAIPFVKNPFNHNPVNMGPAINSEKREYFPSLTADERYFVYTRLVRYNPAGPSDEDILLSEMGSDGRYMPSKSISNLINTPYQEGAVNISPDGQYIFFASNNPEKGMGRFDIYVSHRTADGWSKPENAGAPLNTSDWESQPCFSPDGRTLYFASRREGGYGKEDIWMCTYENGKFGDPVNLGPEINTPETDESPFIYFDNQTLYFSSTGHTGFGGHDLFISRRDENGKWQKPQNLGMPINTPGTELSLTISRSGKKGFYASSNKEIPGDLDIFEFDLPEWAQPQPVSYVKGYIFDAATLDRLKANIELIDLKTGKTVAQLQSNESTGEYLICLVANRDYALNVNGKGYLFRSENFSLHEHPSTAPFQLNVGLHKLKVGETVVLKNIFFDVDKATLKPESKAELGKLIAFMKEYPTMKIEISGHTDNTGTSAYNITLSNNRAKTVFDYLVTNGIQAARLTYKGYGDTKPVAPNDSDENKARNRRTEFKITAL